TLNTRIDACLGAVDLYICAGMNSRCNPISAPGPDNFDQRASTSPQTPSIVLPTSAIGPVYIGVAPDATSAVADPLYQLYLSTGCPTLTLPSAPVQAVYVTSANTQATVSWQPALLSTPGMSPAPAAGVFYRAILFPAASVGTVLGFNLLTNCGIEAAVAN